jgi:hypothetical protein
MEGLGNIMVFFPAAYYFAALTGREILIPDKSILGIFCSLIRCGFPYVESLSNAYPDVLTYQAIKDASPMRAHHFNLHIEGREVHNQPIVRAIGNTARSDWWVYYNESAACISRITGCVRGDIACADRHAYQSLVKGPFIQEHLINRYMEKLIGIPNNLKLSFLTLPHTYAQRIDVGIHIRCQFAAFENKTWTNTVEESYQKEILDWLASYEAKQVLESFEERILGMSKEQLPVPVPVPVSNQEKNWTRDDPFYVYIAADNQQVKDALVARLRPYQNDSRYLIHTIMLTSKHIVHTKHLNSLVSSTDGEGLADLALDWYMLTLSNVILGWRKGFSPGISTFMMSAQRVSGNKARTNTFVPIDEGGIGTKAYLFIKNKRGYPFWSTVWVHNVIEDYRRL